MAPSAADLVTAAVEQAFDAVRGNSSPSSAPTFVSGSFRQSVEQAMAGPPDPVALSALDRAIQAGARRLSALGTRVAAVRSNSTAAISFCWQIVAGCTVCHDLALLAQKFELIGAASALICCASLPLECGRALLAQQAVSSLIAGLEGPLLHQQALLLGLLAGFSGRDESTATLFSTHAPPEALLSWLSAAISTLPVLQASPQDRGIAHKVQDSLVAVIACITCTPICTHFTAALQLNSALQHSVMQLLVRALHAAAVTAQLPVDRWPNVLGFIRTVMDIPSALTSPALCGTFKELLAQPISSGGISTSSQRVLQSAAALFGADPARRSASCRPSTVYTVRHTALNVLGFVCSAVGIGQEQHGNVALPVAQRQQLLRVLLPAFLQLPTALRSVAEEVEARGRPEYAFRMSTKTLRQCQHIIGLTYVLAAGAPGQSPGHGAAAAPCPLAGLAEVPAWCTAGSAMLRSLRHVPGLVASTQEYQFVGVIVTAGLTDTASTLVQAVATSCSSLGSGAFCSAADGAAAVEALWQLHTTLCRCIHSVLAGSTAGLSMNKLLQHLRGSMEAAASIIKLMHPTDEAGTGNIERQLSPLPRHLLAMSVAHSEAVLAAASSVQPAPADEDVAAGLVVAMMHGPAALASNPPVQQVLLQSSGRLGLAGGMMALLHREPQPGDALELARVAATRSCAYLRCANLAGEGGPAAGQGTGSQRCSKCRLAWYCGTACSHADWRAGHRRLCRALGAARVAAQESGDQ